MGQIDWPLLVKQWEKSGLSQQKFCSREGISLHCFLREKRHLYQQEVLQNRELFDRALKTGLVGSLNPHVVKFYRHSVAQKKAITGCFKVHSQEWWGRCIEGYLYGDVPLCQWCEENGVSVECFYEHKKIYDSRREMLSKWEGYLQQQFCSGMTKEAWCQQEGLSVADFDHYQWVLGRRIAGFKKACWMRFFRQQAESGISASKWCSENGVDYQQFRRAKQKYDIGIMEGVSTVWRHRIAQQKESGLTVRKWCSENGIMESKFRYWLHKLDGFR